jgi:branched-chain amino acid transport system substrate-binding protein
MRKRSSFALLALFAALSLVAAACTGDEEGETGPTGATTTGATGAVTGGAADCAADAFGCIEIGADEPIQIAALQTLTTPDAPLGLDQIVGLKLAMDNLDGAMDGVRGQLLGHDITLVQQDELCSAEGGTAGATTLAAVPDLAAVFGTTCSSAALGTGDTILGAEGILLISGSNTNPNLTAEGVHQDFYLRTAHNDKIQGAIVAEYLYNELGLRSIATINDESPYSDALAAVGRAVFESLGGTVTGFEAVTSTDTEFKPVLTSLAQGSPEALYYPAFAQVCGLVTAQARDLPEYDDVVLIGSDGCASADALELAGDAAEGWYRSGPDTTVFQQGDFYKDTFLPAYKELEGLDATYSVFHAHIFDAFNIWAEAMAAVAVQNDDGSLTVSRTALKDAVYATSGFDGLTGTITCTPLGDCATDVVIGIFQAPDWPEINSDSTTVYGDVKSLQEVADQYGI